MVGRREPSPGLLRRVEAFARALLPGFGTALTMAAAAGPTGLPALVPAVALPQVVFWSIVRPGAMSPQVAFALGLLLDLLTLAPLGTGALVMLVAHGLAVTWRRFLARQGFAMAWLIFGGFAAGAAGAWLSARGAALFLAAAGRPGAESGHLDHLPLSGLRAGARAAARDDASRGGRRMRRRAQGEAS